MIYSCSSFRPQGGWDMFGRCDICGHIVQSGWSILPLDEDNHSGFSDLFRPFMWLDIRLSDGSHGHKCGQCQELVIYESWEPGVTPRPDAGEAA